MTQHHISYGPLKDLSEHVQCEIQYMVQQMSDPNHEGWKHDRAEAYFEIDENHLFLHDRPSVFMITLNTLIALMLTPMICMGVIGIHQPIQEGRWGALLAGILFLGALIWIVKVVVRLAFSQLKLYRAEKSSPRAGLYLLPDCIMIRGYEDQLDWDATDYPYQYIPKTAIKEIKQSTSRGRRVGSSKEVVTLIFYDQDRQKITDWVITSRVYSAMGKAFLPYLEEWHRRRDHNQ